MPTSLQEPTQPATIPQDFDARFAYAVVQRQDFPIPAIEDPDIKTAFERLVKLGVIAPEASLPYCYQDLAHEDPWGLPDLPAGAGHLSRQQLYAFARDAAAAGTPVLVQSKPDATTAEWARVVALHNEFQETYLNFLREQGATEEQVDERFLAVRSLDLDYMRCTLETILEARPVAVNLGDVHTVRPMFRGLIVGERGTLERSPFHPNLSPYQPPGYAVRVARAAWNEHIMLDTLARKSVTE